MTVGRTDATAASSVNGHSTGAPAAVAGARSDGTAALPAGLAGETARIVHLAPPSSAGQASADDVARALQEHFLANADRGDNAANDELVAELVRRLRALRACREGGD